MTDRETSIRRGVEILLSLSSEEAVAEGGLGVTRIAQHLEREKSAVSRALKALAEYGLVERRPDELTYHLGWRLYAMAQAAGRPRFVEEAAPVLAELVASLSERVHLSVLQGTDVLTLLSDSPGRAVEAVGWTGRTTPAYCTSAGQALLMDHEPAALERLLAGVVFAPVGPRTIPDLATLTARLAAARAVGHVVADEEFEQGLVSVATPVRDGRGAIVACLNVSAPRDRFLPHVPRAVTETVAAARRLSAALGSSAPFAAASEGEDEPDPDADGAGDLAADRA